LTNEKLNSERRKVKMQVPKEKVTEKIILEVSKFGKQFRLLEIKTTSFTKKARWWAYTGSNSFNSKTRVDYHFQWRNEFGDTWGRTPIFDEKTKRCATSAATKVFFEAIAAAENMNFTERNL